MAGPRLFESLRNGYSLKVFGRDLSAGLIVGIVAVPLALAFAIASGLPPEKGLVTAVVAGFLISALGGSSVQIGGPTGAFVVIVFGIQAHYGVEGLVGATILAGLFLLVLGFAKLGTVIQYIPYPVIVGFTSGIAVTIFSSQVNDLLGLGLRQVPAEFTDKWLLFLSDLAQTNFWSLTLAAATILIIVTLARLDHRVPGALIALFLTTLAVLFFQLPVDTIGSRFGVIAGSLPVPTFPTSALSHWRDLLLPALSIAMLAGIESLLSAAVADGLTGKKHDSNQELIGQGVANIASALFGGMPATGAIARTATNVKSGGQTPVAGIVHAVFLLLVLLFLAPLAALIPLAALAGILVTVSYNMSEHRTFRLLLKGPRGDAVVLVSTFLLTVLVDLTVAIPVGVLFALLVFLRKASATGRITIHRDELRESSDEIDPFGFTKIDLPPGVEVFEIEGPFFFGAAERFKEAMLVIESAPRVRILRLRHVSSIDASGILVLDDILLDARKQGTQLLLASVRPEVRSELKRSGFLQRLGEENLALGILPALEKAKTFLGDPDATLAQRLRRGGTLNLPPGSFADLVQQAQARFPTSSTLARALAHSILEREALASTVLVPGIAFPHPKEPILGPHDPEFITVVYTASTIDDAPLVLFFLGARSASSHLQALKDLVGLCRKEEFQALLDANAGAEELANWVEAGRS